MKGVCNSCGILYDVEYLGGYNVRQGSIADALCHSCIDYYYTEKEVFKANWFDVLLNRVRRMKRAKAQLEEKNRRQGWEQTNIYMGGD